MSCRSNYVLGVLLLVVFVIGIGSSRLRCAGDGHSATARASQHCMLHCGCHTPAVTPSDPQPVWSPPLSHLVLSDVPLKLPLFAASIFHPPKA